MREIVAWRMGLFLTEEKIGVLSVSSLLLTRVGVYVGVFVCIHTHTHTHCTDGVLVCEPRSGKRYPEGPKNPDGLNLIIHTFVYVYNVHMCIHILRGGMRSWTNCFFL